MVPPQKGLIVDTTERQHWFDGSKPPADNKQSLNLNRQASQ